MEGEVEGEVIGGGGILCNDRSVRPKCHRQRIAYCRSGDDVTFDGGSGMVAEEQSG